MRLGMNTKVRLRTYQLSKVCQQLGKVHSPVFLLLSKVNETA